MSDPASPLTLDARALWRSFAGRPVVRDVEIKVGRGEVLGFLGPNGAGKTTTMQMLTGNLSPGAGSISICGADLLMHPVAAKRHVGYLPETPPLYKELSVTEYLELAARLHRVGKQKVASAAANARERCGLATVGNRLIGTLSKGYQQRVGIAQAIVHEPDLMILDEPTVGLDPNQIREIRSLIRELGRGRGVILSTHILPEVETVCDRVQIMHEGSVVFSGTVEELRALRGGRALVVGLRRPPPIAELEAVPGVARAEATGRDLFRIEPEADADVGEEIVRRAVAQGWRLFQIAPAQASLEEIFGHLTQREDATTGVAA
ncbi:MAG: ABC transporter ATP-binding protein [Burkholderiales bacterium]|jgi:ABC-2 type transport system ATP-binding protein|nr:ABC transporter ATP-binding protein [Burkholderiales bacterium]